MSGRLPGSNALRASSRTWDALSQANCGVVARRCFSVSYAHQAGQVASFPPTSSSELDQILSDIRMKILLPSYLPFEQRKKLYQPKYENKLRNDPITMEIDGEVLKFPHRDLFKDVPNTRKSLFAAVNLMETAEDWALLPTLLESLHHYANRRLKFTDFAKLTRKAGNKGHIFAIIECVKQANKTSFRLDASEKVNELLTQLQLPLVNGQNDQKSIAHLLKQVELVIEWLEDDKHKARIARGEKRPAAFPVYRDPQVLAARLHLAAQLAVANGSKDDDGKVLSYAQDIVEVWPEGAGLLELHPPEAYADAEGLRYLTEKNNFLLYASPVLKGLVLAGEILKQDHPDVAEALQKRATLVAREVEAARQDTSRPQNGRGELLYNKLFGDA